jgi:hypothetical protein
MASQFNTLQLCRHFSSSRALLLPYTTALQPLLLSWQGTFPGVDAGKSPRRRVKAENRVGNEIRNDFFAIVHNTTEVAFLHLFACTPKK